MNGAMPDALRRPERGEAPRFPKDLVIGELGQGEAPDGAYLFARNFLSALSAGSRNATVLMNSDSTLIESLLDDIADIRTRSYRLGGGRTEADGSVSFMVRFMGLQESIAGELFVRMEETTEAEGNGTRRWLLDDLILEEKRPLSETKDSYRYDFSPYERFY